jgi:hypothetical protein
MILKHASLQISIYVYDNLNIRHQSIINIISSCKQYECKLTLLGIHNES